MHRYQLHAHTDEELIALGLDSEDVLCRVLAERLEELRGEMKDCGEDWRFEDE